MSAPFKSTLWFTCLAPVIAVAIAFIRPQEPHYHGRPLSEWLSTFTIVPYNTNSPGYQQACEAVRQIGPRAIPYLLSLYRHEVGRSKLNVALTSYLNSLPKPMVPTRLQAWLDEAMSTTPYEQADMGFSLLGSNAAPAIPQLFQFATNQASECRARWVTGALGYIGAMALPELLQIMTNPQSPGRRDAIWALPFVAPNAVNAVPALISCIDDPREDDISCDAVEALTDMTIPPDAVVSLLVRALKTGSPRAKGAAADHLPAYGKTARAAIPDLKKAFLDDDDDFVSSKSFTALMQIAPEVLLNPSSN
jgi:hypothetical protein